MKNICLDCGAYEFEYHKTDCLFMYYKFDNENPEVYKTAHTSILKAFKDCYYLLAQNYPQGIKQIKKDHLEVVEMTEELE
jgi:hypothetical protein